MSLLVRSPGHVKWPHLRKILNVCHSYTKWPITLKLSALMSVPVSMKRISRNFDIGDLESGQFCDLSSISQWEKNERLLFCTKAIQNTLKHRVTGRIDTLSRNIVTGDPLSCRQGQFRSWKVTCSFSGIPFDRDQLDRWKHHRCVQVDDTNRLICNMTCSDQVMTLTWGQTFNMTFQGQLIYHSMRLYTREIRCWQKKCCVSTESKVITEKRFSQKNG